MQFQNYVKCWKSKVDLNDVNVSDKSRQHAEKHASGGNSKLHSDESNILSDISAEQSEVQQYQVMHLHDGAIDYFA